MAPEPAQTLEDQMGAAFEQPEDELVPEGPVAHEEPTEDEEPTEPTEGEEQEEPQVETVLIGGREVPLPVAQELISFYDWAAANPHLVEQFGAVASGQARVVPLDEQPASNGRAPAPEQAAITDEDLEDLPEPIRDRIKRIDDIEAQFTALQQAQFEQSRTQALGAIEQGSKNFASRYGLDTPTLEAIQSDLVRMGVLPVFIQNAGGDVTRGTEEALEVAYFRNPQYRQRELDRIASASTQAQSRQRKASKLSGSSGSSPRASQPSNPQEAKQAIIDEIAQHWRGGAEAAT